MKNQTGNALFLILIAVALFAALSYAVTNSGRGGGIDKETARISATEIQNFLIDARLAADRLSIVRNIDANDMGLGGGIWKNGAGTPAYSCAAGVNDESEIFDPLGGGAAPRSFEEYAIENPNCCNSMTPGHVYMQYSDLRDIGTNKEDIILAISLVKLEICNAFNTINGWNSNFDGSEPAWSSTNGPNLRCGAPGTLDQTPSSFGYAGDSLSIPNTSEFCAPLQVNGFKHYAILKVLIER